MHPGPLTAMIACMLALGAVCAAAAQEKVSCLRSPPTDRRNDLYISNRPPLSASPMVKLPIGSIRPGGWLRHMLELETQGFSGRLTEISRFCKAEGNAWLSPTGEGHSPWEELPYWLKGFGDLGYVLGDERIIREARRWIEGILASQQDDGWFGPRANRTGGRKETGAPDMWPNMLALNALQSFHEFTGDKRVPPFMARYFRWQASVPEDKFLVPYWQKMRAGDNLESIYWLYNRTGEPWLLEVAAKVHRGTANWTDGVPNWHGVNISQCFRQPAIYWVQAGEERFRQAAYRNYDAVMGLYGQVPGGGFGADENCRKGFHDPRQGTESCTFVEFMHSFQMLTRITGDPLWADRCEEIAFNSFPASMTPDLKALHYLTAPNQPQLDRENHSPGIENRGCMFAYDPRGYRCCQHNLAMGWPYYAEELWLATADNGLCASLYAACTVKAKIGDGTEVTVSEQTEYPFSEVVRLKLTSPRPAAFPLYLRVPRWCDAPKVRLNGKPIDVKAGPLTYLVMERTWNDGDEVVLLLPMRLGARVWQKNRNAVSVDYGPLTFSLKIGERWVRGGKEDDDWPTWEVFPTTPWNYGLELDPARPQESIEVAWKKDSAPTTQPFTPEAAPVELRAKARRIPEWTFDRHGLCAVLQDSPAYTQEPLETVTLIPMGCARLRISAFPTVSAKPLANKWSQQPRPAYAASASHCWRADSVEALCDGSAPKQSNDRSIPRFTWWDHKGTAEWVAYKLKAPRTLSWAEVYWFDDTGSGGCRTPASWRMAYKDGEQWKPVTLAAGAAYGVEKDKFNRVAFEPVTAAEVRLEVQLREGFSAGILEWRIGDEKDSGPDPVMR